MPQKPQQIESVIVANVRESVSFDSVIAKGNKVQALAARYLSQIMFNPDEAGRAKAVEGIQADIVAHFENVVVPAAVQTGRKQAAQLVGAIGGNRPAADVINDPAARRQILYDGTLRVSQRVQAFQRLVNDSGNTLENRLGAFWLEPGRTDGQKLDTLRRIHEQQEAARKKYEERLALFRDGKGSRPARPQLDYLSSFQAKVMDDTRSTARRAGTDAEHAEFQARGFKVFTWITVNAGDACPDCRRRQGTTGTMDYFERIGRPGAGATVCGARCFCILVPKETVYHAPGLARGVIVGDGGERPGPKPVPVVTDPKTAAEIDAAKIDPPAAPVASAKSPKERLREALDADAEAGNVHTKVLATAQRWEKRIQKAEAQAATHETELERVHKQVIALADDPNVSNDEYATRLLPLNEQLDAASKAYHAAKDEADRLKKEMLPAVRKAMAVAPDERMKDVALVPMPTGLTGRVAWEAPTTKANAAEAASFVQSVWKRAPEFAGVNAGGGNVGALAVDVQQLPAGSRAHHNGPARGNEGARNYIAIQEGEPTRVIVHELGHELEARHSQGHLLARTFLDSRTSGQTVRKLKDVLPRYNYRDDEKGRDDDFGKAFGPDHAWYVGKEYDFSATEIISMGLEMLYANPLALARADAEYFRFLLGFLRGTISI